MSRTNEKPLNMQKINYMSSDVLVDIDEVDIGRYVSLSCRKIVKPMQY